METMKKIAVILVLTLLCFAGCDSDLSGVSGSDNDKLLSGGNGNFTFIQEYGYCDTSCIAENVILGDYILPYITECYVRNFNTGDTVYNGLYQSNFLLLYNTSMSVSINLGNGETRTYRGQGVDTLKYFCNKNYEVIICYD